MEVILFILTSLWKQRGMWVEEILGFIPWSLEDPHGALGKGMNLVNVRAFAP